MSTSTVHAKYPWKFSDNIDQATIDDSAGTTTGASPGDTIDASTLIGAIDLS